MAKIGLYISLEDLEGFCPDGQRNFGQISMNKVLIYPEGQFISSREEELWYMITETVFQVHLGAFT